jgi:hypothetical protein
LTAFFSAGFIINGTGVNYGGVLPWIGLHLAFLLWLLIASRAATRGMSAAIVCALAYIMWFVGTPLWQLIAGR